jgi:hypothetical protein
MQWLQASLPVSKGGLGIRLASQLAPSAFLASAVGTRRLQDDILLRCTDALTEDISVNEALAVWSGDHNTNAPAQTVAGKQKCWDGPVVELYNRLLESLPNAIDRARILAVSAPHISDWLHAL